MLGLLKKQRKSGDTPVLENSSVKLEKVQGSRSKIERATGVILEIVIGMEIKIFDGQSSGVFSNEPFENRLVMYIYIYFYI